MAQPFYARKTDLKIGPRKGETVYSAQAYYYGVLTTRQVATQIAQESALTQADVLGVIERLAYFCRRHLALGYKVKLEGMGIFYNQFVTSNTVKTPEEVTSKLIKTIRPAFSPEYAIVNGNFYYTMLPFKTELEKIEFTDKLLKPVEERVDEPAPQGGDPKPHGGDSKPEGDDPKLQGGDPKPVEGTGAGI